MEVVPDKQNIDSVFGNTTYRIDFYQRDYRWTEDHVKRLLEDVFFRFRDTYSRLDSLDATKPNVVANYPWYYLSTYVTNSVDGHVYVVDGQQRLTTLALILIKLYHMANALESSLVKWIDAKITGHSGHDNQFWITHAGEEPIQDALYEGREPEIDEGSSLTARNMVKNYNIISEWLDRELSQKHAFETFVFYFLELLVLVDLRVVQTDVPMLFEVINDRGLGLRPHEILKGKLLGQIDKGELTRDGYADLWDARAESINGLRDDQLDEFFRSYLKAKYANTRAGGRRFDGDYHRQMFSENMNKVLGLDRAPTRVKTFLKEDFRYFSELYERVWQAYTAPTDQLLHLYYNGLLDIDAPFLLAIATCRLEDIDEDSKMSKVGYEIDRYFSLLQLQNAYDSNDFQDSLYDITVALRNQPVDAIRPAFDKQLRIAIAASRDISNVEDVEPLSYASFRQTGVNLNPRFKRYFFARIDEFLAREMNLNPKHPIDHLVTRTGAKTGFHVEHILSMNEENLTLFGEDEERFEEERNRLGGILLLKGKDNISSGNETFKQKLKTYANTLYWNETLREDSYKSKLDMHGFKAKHGLNLEPLSQFGPEELETRHRLLFDLVKIIWA